MMWQVLGTRFNEIEMTHVITRVHEDTEKGAKDLLLIGILQYRSNLLLTHESK